MKGGNIGQIEMFRMKIQFDLFDVDSKAEIFVGC